MNKSIIGIKVLAFRFLSGTEDDTLMEYKYSGNKNIQVITIFKEYKYSGNKNIQGIKELREY